MTKAADTAQGMVAAEFDMTPNLWDTDAVNGVQAIVAAKLLKAVGARAIEGSLAWRIVPAGDVRAALEAIDSGDTEAPAGFDLSGVDAMGRRILREFVTANPFGGLVVATVRVKG